jgi:phenylacetate-CoA ligase
VFQPSIETLPPDQLIRLQTERLNQQVARLWDRSAFYRERFLEAGLEPRQQLALSDLQALRPTVKEDLRQHYPFGLIIEPMERVARLHASSGTTGKLTVSGFSARDLQVLGEICARSLAAAGARPGMMLHNAYGYGLFTGGLGLHAGAETLGLTVVPVSGGMTERQITLLLDFKPQVLSCTPSYALTLAEECRRRGIGPDEHGLRYAVLGAEPWTESIRSAVQEGLGVRATNIYGLSELSGPGVAQEEVEEQGTGSYLWEDHFYPEILHPDSGEPMPDGQPGVLVLSALTREAMPLLRYWTGDITWLKRDHGGRRTHAKMGPVLGRSDDMLILRGVNLFPSQIEAVLQALPELSVQFRLVVERTRTLDEAEVQVEWSPAAQAQWGDPQTGDPQGAGREAAAQTAAQLQHLIREQTGLNMAVSLLAAGSLPRSEGGKSSHVVDRRKLDEG